MKKIIVILMIIGISCLNMIASAEVIDYNFIASSADIEGDNQSKLTFKDVNDDQVSDIKDVLILLQFITGLNK